MPRALRIEFPGAVYHVMARGQRRELIFRNDADRADFLEWPHERGRAFHFDIFV